MNALNTAMMVIGYWFVAAIIFAGLWIGFVRIGRRLRTAQ